MKKTILFLKYVSILLLVFCFSCQKKQYASMQKSSGIHYEHNVKKEKELVQNTEILAQIDAILPVIKPTENFGQKGGEAINFEDFSTKSTTNKNLSNVSKTEKQSISDSLIKSKPDITLAEKKQRKDAKIAGLMGLSSYFWIHLSTTQFGQVFMLYFAYISSISGIVLGIKALRKLKTRRFMAWLGVILGIIVLCLSLLVSLLISLNR